MIDTVLFDLDGVIRHFDPDHVATTEARHGLAPGALWAAGAVELGMTAHHFDGIGALRTQLIDLGLLGDT